MIPSKKEGNESNLSEVLPVACCLELRSGARACQQSFTLKNIRGGKGASINNVDKQEEGRDCPNFQTYQYICLRRGVKNPQNFVDVVYGCPLKQVRGARETTLFSLKHTRINVLVGTWKLFGLLICHCYCFVLKRRALKPDVIFLIINIRTINTPNIDTYKEMYSMQNCGYLLSSNFQK